MGRRLSVILALAALCLCLTAAMAPAPGRGKTSRPRPADSRVHLLHADKLYFDERLDRAAQFLVGNVELSHDGVLMYCDSALFYEASNSFDAFGNVRMVQGDTLSLRSEVLYYNGMDQLARARERVVLKHRSMDLYTDSLDYDRLFDLGYFFEGGRLVDKDNELTSDWGEYSPSTREAIFNYNVRLVNPAPPAKPSTVLLSDTLHYNTLTAVARIVGPSNIEHGQSHIYSESGLYDTRADHSHLLLRSILTNNGKRLTGDSVVWEGTESVGKAFGHVIYTDEVSRNMFTGGYLLYNDSTGYMEAADSAVAIDYSQKDTMWAHADTFKVYSYHLDTDSAYRVMHAYHHLRAFRADIQAVCDSLVYNTLDSCMTMYRDPIVWQQGQQLLGEEIKAFLNDSTVDSVQVLRQTLSVERLDSVHYNQVAGREMHSYFTGGEPRLTTVEGNVFLNYYPFDDDSVMIEMNHTETSLLRLFLQDRKVDRVWMPEASGVMYPIPQIPPDKLYLENFAWFDYIRPLHKDDLFEWRPKREGTELRESVTRKAPKQRLDEVVWRIQK